MTRARTRSGCAWARVPRFPRPWICRVTGKRPVLTRTPSTCPGCGDAVTREHVEVRKGA